MATLKEIHDVQLRMMQDFDKLCDALHLKYFMVGGTMLGAVRHRGFIPWDDDVDLYMPMEDARILEDSFHSDQYFLQTPDSDLEMPYIMFKLRKNNTSMPQFPLENHLNIHKGVWIDIFLYTDAGKNEAAKKMQVFLMRALQSFRCRYYHFRDHPDRKIHALLVKLPNRLSLFIDRMLLNGIQALGSKKSGEYFAMDVCDPLFFKKSFFDNLVQYPFEGASFWGIEEYDEFLSGYYGDDYMTPKKWGHIEDYSRVTL